MKVRLTHTSCAGVLMWRVESRRWYWPFWEIEDFFRDYEEAMVAAKHLSNPDIEVVL